MYTNHLIDAYTVYQYTLKLTFFLVFFLNKDISFDNP